MSECKWPLVAEAPRRRTLPVLKGGGRRPTLERPQRKKDI